MLEKIKSQIMTRNYNKKKEDMNGLVIYVLKSRRELTKTLSLQKIALLMELGMVYLLLLKCTMPHPLTTL
jgi:hypothetical protein